MKTNPDDPVPDRVPDPVPDANIVPMFEDATTEISPPGDDPTNSPNVDELVNRTMKILQQGIQNTKRGLKEILEGALHLMDLKSRHKRQGARNDLVSHEMKSGYLQVLHKLNIPPATAHRWTSQARAFILELGITEDSLPAVDSAEWVRMVKCVKKRVEHIDRLGLPINPIPTPKDEGILTRLRAAAAAGHELATQLLMEIESGETTIAEATHRYCQTEKIKRPPPALIKLNPKTLQPEGRAIKAMDVIEELLAEWEQIPLDIRVQARPRIREMIGKIPPDCRFHDT